MWSTVQPLLYGKEQDKGLRLNTRTLSLESVTIGEDGISEQIFWCTTKPTHPRTTAARNECAAADRHGHHPSGRKAELRRHFLAQQTHRAPGQGR